LKNDKNPSPDCNENPFLQKKDCNGKQEKASNKKFGTDYK
jgi:hypothetical protein